MTNCNGVYLFPVIPRDSQAAYPAKPPDVTAGALAPMLKGTGALHGM